MTATIGVLTRKPLAELLAEGGTSAWVLNRPKASSYPFVVCMHNAPPEAFHGDAFLVARIGKIVPARDDPGRWMIEFAEYAEVAIPRAWGIRRNPVRYTTLEELGIDPNKLTFSPMPEIAGRKNVVRPASPGLTIAEAKAALALTFGVPPDAIEITIRG